MTTKPKLTEAQRALPSKVSQREAGFATPPKIARIAAEKTGASAFTSAGSARVVAAQARSPHSRVSRRSSTPRSAGWTAERFTESRHTVQANRIPSPACA